MRQIIIAIILFSTPAICAAGDSRLLFLAASSQCKPQTSTVNSINGETIVSNGDVTDTGVATPSANYLCSGTASIVASCYGGDSGSFSQVILKINGTAVQTLSCGATVTQNNVTLSWPVSGTYTAEVFGVSSGDGTFAAAGFSFPVAQ